MKLGWVFLAITALVLIGVRARDCQLPYFWDELGVYGPAALHLVDHGLGLDPASIPPELSRGHPGLVANLHAVSFRIFGPSHVTGHVTALGLSVLLVIATGWIGLRLFGNPLAALVLLVQPIFQAQSVLVLPEIPLALAILLGTYAYAQRRHAIAGVAFLVAVWMKETSAIVPAALVLLDARELFQALRARRGGSALRLALVAVLPAIGLGVFLGLQKIQHGWFLFPYHVDTVSLDPDRLLLHLREHTKFLFWDQGRYAVAPFLLVSLIPGRASRDAGQRFLWASVGILVVSLTFFSTTFFMRRYLLYLLPLVAVAVTAVWSRIGLPRWTWSLGLLLLVPILFWNPAGWKHDEDLSYRDQVRGQRDATRFLESQFDGDPLPISCGFPMRSGIFDPRLGYVSSTERFVDADVESTVWAVVNNPGYGPKVEEDPRFLLAQTFQNRLSWTYVYRRVD